MLDKLLWIFRPKAHSALTTVLERFGGAYKRVDENRELLELLQAKAPKLLEDCPWVVGWIRSNDEVFTALESLSSSLSASNQQFTKRAGFPRPWPELPEKQKTSATVIAETIKLEAQEPPPEFAGERIRYFVSYSHAHGFGNADMRLDNSIRSFSDVRSVAQMIEKAGVLDVVILHWQCYDSALPSGGGNERNEDEGVQKGVVFGLRLAG